MAPSLASSMAAYLPRLGADKIKLLVDFVISQDISDPADFEDISPESFAAIPHDTLTLGLRTALTSYVRAKYRPPAERHLEYNKFKFTEWGAARLHGLSVALFSQLVEDRLKVEDVRKRPFCCFNP